MCVCVTIPFQPEIYSSHLVTCATESLWFSNGKIPGYSCILGIPIPPAATQIFIEVLHVKVGDTKVGINCTQICRLDSWGNRWDWVLRKPTLIELWLAHGHPAVACRGVGYLVCYSLLQKVTFALSFSWPREVAWSLRTLILIPTGELVLLSGREWDPFQRHPHTHTHTACSLPLIPNGSRNCVSWCLLVSWRWAYETQKVLHGLGNNRQCEVVPTSQTWLVKSWTRPRLAQPSCVCSVLFMPLGLATSCGCARSWTKWRLCGD